MLIEMNNNQRIPAFQAQQPQDYLRRAGLGDASTGLPDASTMTALNSEAVFLTNLWRQSQGLAPLNTSASAPTVNVGLSDDSKKMLGVAALLGLFLVARRHR